MRKLILLTFTFYCIFNSFAAGEDCSSAINLTAGTCYAESTDGNAFTGTPSSCLADAALQNGSRWFRLALPASGQAHIRVKSEFNDLMTVYTGTCNTLVEVACSNKDEHGFVGEQYKITGNPGESVRVRVSGVLSEFGLPSGDFCIIWEDGYLIDTAPVNDMCASAETLIVDNINSCNPGHNVEASIVEVPDQNLRSRASVWYNFIAPTSGNVKIKTNSWFSDVIRLHSGTCGALNQEQIELDGFEMNALGLTAGQNYFVQVTGFFAGLESNICIEVESLPFTPANDQCTYAVALDLDGDCINGSLDAATPGTKISDCYLNDGPGLWYKLYAPSGGEFYLDIDADFPYNLSVWKGNCNSVEEIFCGQALANCDGLPLVSAPTGFINYFINVSSTERFDHGSGSFCIRALSSSVGENITPLFAEGITTCFADGTAELAQTIGGGSGDYTIYGAQEGDILQPGSEFEFTVTDEAGCAAYEKGFVDCKDFSAQCPTINDLTALSVLDNSASFSWTATDQSQLYFLQYRELGSDVWEQTQGSVPFVILSNLSPCTDYEVRVTSACSGLLSGYDEYRYITTTGCDICEPPANLYTYNITASSAILTWDVMVNINEYKLKYRLVGDTDWNYYNTSYPLAILFGLPACATVEWAMEIECTSGSISNESNLETFATISCKNGNEWLSAEEEVSATEFNIFPNPASDKIYLTMLSEFSGDVYVNIYDAVGRMVYSKQKSAEQSVLEINDFGRLENGIYKVEVSNGEEVWFEKLLIQH